MAGRLYQTRATVLPGGADDVGFMWCLSGTQPSVFVQIKDDGEPVDIPADAVLRTRVEGVDGFVNSDNELDPSSTIDAAVAVQSWPFAVSAAHRGVCRLLVPADSIPTIPELNQPLAPIRLCHLSVELSTVQVHGARMIVAYARAFPPVARPVTPGAFPGQPWLGEPDFVWDVALHTMTANEAVVG